ncbi:MAG: membrane protein insertase YidC [Bacteroidetes bacterium]|jgi:YidC/Oxa1 family membrane protein insertase|nr:membrane protein insertase YidC [Bacteroidota bacterium]
MDRNSITGVVLIIVVLIGFAFFNQPSEEEIRAAKHRQDSIALAEKRTQELVKIKTDSARFVQADTTISTDSLTDSLKENNFKQLYGDFASAAKGEDKSITLENNLLKLHISSKGGKISYVELKDYKTWDGKPLVLNNGDSSVFSFNFFSDNRVVRTNDLFWTLPANGIKVSEKDSGSVSVKLEAGEGRYIEYVYSLKGNDYRVGLKVNFVNLNNLVAANAGYMELDWTQKLLQQEKSHKNESAVSTAYYRFTDEEVDHLSETKDDASELKTKVQWVGFKQQYFSSVLIAEKSFESPTKISSKIMADQGAVRYMAANFTIPYNHSSMESTDLSFYFGPNHYQTLKKYHIGMEKLVPLGWGIFGWVNRYAVIPIFNFLNSFNINYGIIILILTLVIKLALLPLTYKSYMSTAKMKVLQPEIAELQGKFKEEPMKLQQEMMTLYRKAGVNPLGGCLPMLLQMPILIAMFRFFPASIELRQKGFLWAHDLSTYDSILDLPFNIPFYGDHVSLFTILMTVSTIIYTRLNQQMTAATNPSMKYVMYLMPIMFLGIFNNYSAGLSYYYFLANMITFGQTYFFKLFVDEKAIHARIQENKKKQVKKSKFQERLEKMAKERGVKR